MATQQRNVSTRKNPVLNVKKARFTGLIPPLAEMDIIFYHHYNRLIHDLRDALSLQLPTVLTLLWIVGEYTLRGNLSSCWSICKGVETSAQPATYNRMKERIKILLKHDLITVVDIVKSHNRYAPTEKAINIVSQTLRSLTNLNKAC